MAQDKLDLKTHTFTHWLTLPIDNDPLKSRTDWQGATIAVHPRSGAVYLYQMQVNRTGPGDVEDIWVHVFHITGGKAVFKFSTVVKRAGHVQSLHVRISVHGRHWAWMGCENYVKNKTKGGSLWRLRLRRGTVKLGSSSECKKIIAGPGVAQAIGCFDGAGKSDFTVVLRRPESLTEVYEWYNESDLINWRDPKKKPPVRAWIRVLREGGTYQSACATGTWKTAARNGLIYRINGKTEQRTTVRRYSVAGIKKILAKTRLNGKLKDRYWDITNYAPAHAVPVTSEEGEAIMDSPWGILAGKRANSAKRLSLIHI